MDIDLKFATAIENFKREKYTKVTNICQDLIRVSSSSKIYNLYGLALQKKNKFKESILKLNRAIEIDENNFEALNNLAISLKHDNQLDLSEKTYQRCLEINPNFLQALVNYALLKESKNQLNESIDLLLRALEIKPNPNISFILTMITRMYLYLGKFEDAKFYAHKATEINPNDINAYVTISALTNHKSDRSIIDKMRKMINSPNITDIGLIILSFALGKAYESIEDFDQAFNSFKLANILKKRNTNSNLNEIIKLKNQIITIFKKIELSQTKKIISNKKIIFIVGMPRSGTTLVEQIISSHKEVLGTGESGILMNVIFRKFYHRQYESLNINLINKDLLNNENSIQSNYLRMLEDKNFVSDIYTDKSLENFLFLGFIKIYFPNSKIVLLERNIKNVFWSIYKTNFLTSYMNWTYDFEEINNYYKIYLELTNLWKTLIPKDICTIKYEKLINDPVIEIKNLIDFCGIKWDENCLNHHNNKSSIQTASALQARKPIYKLSKNSTDQYSTHLDPIFKLLEDKR